MRALQLTEVLPVVIDSFSYGAIVYVTERINHVHPGCHIFSEVLKETSS